MMQMMLMSTQMEWNVSGFVYLGFVSMCGLFDVVFHSKCMYIKKPILS